MNKGRNKGITILGSAVILIWVLSIPIFLYPIPFLQSHPVAEGLLDDIEEIPDFIKNDTWMKGKMKEEIEAILALNIKAIWVKSFLFIALGVIYGALIILRNNIGRIIAMIVSLYIVANNTYNLFKHPEFIFSPKIVQMRLEMFPAETLRGWASIIISTITIIYLLVPSVIREFKRK